VESFVLFSLLISNWKITKDSRVRSRLRSTTEVSKGSNLHSYQDWYLLNLIQFAYNNRVACDIRSKRGSIEGLHFVQFGCFLCLRLTQITRFILNIFSVIICASTKSSLISWCTQCNYSWVLKTTMVCRKQTNVQSTVRFREACSRSIQDVSILWLKMMNYAKAMYSQNINHVYAPPALLSKD
jgi:hypothetical protein